jgi:hypothetical protein
MSDQQKIFDDVLGFVTLLERSICRRGRYSTPHCPGTGPLGETCGTCRHLDRVEHHDKHYLKCGLMSKLWSRGPGTDIRAKWPACKSWEKKT